MQSKDRGPGKDWGWTPVCGIVGLLVGAFYGFFIFVQLNRDAPVLGGFWHGLHWGIPLGILVGLPLGILAGLIINGTRGFGRPQFRRFDWLAITILLVVLGLLTWKFVVPVFQSA